MADPGLENFDRTLAETNPWMNDVGEGIGPDGQRQFHALRAVFWALRDRLTPDEAFHFGSHLPRLLHGLFWEGYDPAGKPEGYRDRATFGRMLDRLDVPGAFWRRRGRPRGLPAAEPRRHAASVRCGAGGGRRAHPVPLLPRRPLRRSRRRGPYRRSPAAPRHALWSDEAGGGTGARGDGRAWTGGGEPAGDRRLRPAPARPRAQLAPAPRRLHAGRTGPPRAPTEVHAADIADAVRILATAPAEALAPAVFNASAFVLDRRDLLARYAALAGIDGPLPDRADATAVRAMDCTQRRALGWQPRGADAVDEVLRALA